jgi:hypothetical protein
MINTWTTFSVPVLGDGASTSIDLDLRNIPSAKGTVVADAVFVGVLAGSNLQKSGSTTKIATAQSLSGNRLHLEFADALGDGEQWTLSVWLLISLV